MASRPRASGAERRSSSTDDWIEVASARGESLVGIYECASRASRGCNIIVAMSARYDDIPKIVAGPGSEGMPIRRLGVIGDVHAEDERLEVAIRELRAACAERIVCTGDIADGRGDLDRTVELLEQANVLSVAGNHDRWFLGDTMRDLRTVQYRDFHENAARALSLLPPILELTTVRGPLLLCHAVGRDDMTVLDERTALEMARWMPEFVAIENAARFRFVVAGHVHRFFARRIADLVWINAGTLHRKDDPCFVLVDFEACEIQHFALDDALAVSTSRVPL